MLYQLYEWNHAALTPFRAVADATRLFYQNPLNPLSHTTAGRSVAAMAELFERTTRIYGKPEFGLDETTIRGQRVPVVDKPVWRQPFCDLLHFERALPKGHGKDPRILVVAPMSGHYATLLRGTVEALLPYADVYISDWKDARTVPLSRGRFDLDDYVDYVIEMLRFLGPDTHVIGVCQPAVPVLMATAVMEAAKDPCAPATMTLMGGPIDTRVNPTAVNNLAEERGIDWFRDNVVMAVPFPHGGFMRQVYPGFLQLTGFMSMNLDRHFIAHKDFFWHLVRDDGDSAEKHRTFYDEYNAVMDLTAEFYLQTVEQVFIRHSLPKGEITHRGVRVDLTAIRNTGLLTVEGENDDISGVGQTEAAQDLCVNIPDEKRVHYVQAKVGHYGVFNGSRFRAEIAPRIVDFALTHGTTHTGASGARPEATHTTGPRRTGAYAERIAKAGTLGRSLPATAGESAFGAVAGIGGLNAAMDVLTAPAKAMMSTAMDAAKLSFGSFAGSNNAGFSAPLVSRGQETAPTRPAAAPRQPAAAAPVVQPAPAAAETVQPSPAAVETAVIEAPAAVAESRSPDPTPAAHDDSTAPRAASPAPTGIEESVAETASQQATGGESTAVTASEPATPFPVDAPAAETDAADTQAATVDEAGQDAPRAGGPGPDDSRPDSPVGEADAQQAGSGEAVADSEPVAAMAVDSVETVQTTPTARITATAETDMPRRRAASAAAAREAATDKPKRPAGAAGMARKSRAPGGKNAPGRGRKH
ncbi:polyhydroxyalkanoate depolymerase [Jiella sp. MQZ13P-4]|uniref:Polyhydroxyalkanoate depolymerase n=1 Tax=Jiella sonneratiae TaxID=2816856 RepID=A0ABS3J8X8_9HYPH|nr:polyhydroxyalkanoate depolymerase [Jiella sonneratiae]MBO0906126.1 polyhydroxyalkanoate depolymerase [Jiella sonneratiae]